MCLSLHLATFHFPPLKTLSPNRKGSYCMMEGKNGGERNSGPRTGRESWHLIRLLCVIPKQWLPTFFKQPIWCLPSSPRWKGHSARWISSCSLSLPVSPCWSHSARSPTLLPPLHLPCHQKQFGQRREEVGRSAVGPLCTRRDSHWPNASPDFCLSFTHLVTVQCCLYLEAEAVPEKLLLPVPISTFGVRMSHCQGAPLPGRLLLASYKQQQWECKSSLSPSILSVYPSPTGHGTIWGSWIFRSAICFP